LPQALQHQLTCRQDRCMINAWLHPGHMNEDGLGFMVEGSWFRVYSSSFKLLLKKPWLDNRNRQLTFDSLWIMNTFL
jgi:hypothetical protein